MDKGFFGDVMKSGKPLNSKNKKITIFVIQEKKIEKEIKNRVLYTKSDNSESIFVDNSLIIPLRNSNTRILALLEISNIISDLFGFDEEYFAIVFCNYLSHLFQKLRSFKIYTTEIKFLFFK